MFLPFDAPGRYSLLLVVCRADNHCLSLFLIESCCMQEDMLTAVLAFKRASYPRAGSSFEGYNCQHIPAT